MKKIFAIFASVLLCIAFIFTGCTTTSESANTGEISRKQYQAMKEEVSGSDNHQELVDIIKANIRTSVNDNIDEEIEDDLIIINNVDNDQTLKYYYQTKEGKCFEIKASDDLAREIYVLLHRTDSSYWVEELMPDVTYNWETNVLE